MKRFEEFNEHGSFALSEEEISPFYDRVSKFKFEENSGSPLPSGTIMENKNNQHSFVLKDEHIDYIESAMKNAPTNYTGLQGFQSRVHDDDEKQMGEPQQPNIEFMQSHF